MASKPFIQVPLREVLGNSKRIVSVPDSATAQEALKVLLEKNLQAVPVCAPAGRWLGAGGSELVFGKHQYIGFFSAADVALFLASTKGAFFDHAVALPVTTFLGQTVEGQSLWVMSAETSLVDALEPMSKGVHRVLVPTRPLSPSGPLESARSPDEVSPFDIITQTDIVRFFLENLCRLGPRVSKSLDELGLARPNTHPVAVSANASVMEALRLMKDRGVSAVAIVERSSDSDAAVGEKLLATLSMSDFRALDYSNFATLLEKTVMDFLVHVSGVGVPRPPVTCQPNVSLAEAMGKALTCRVHRVWVTDGETRLRAVVSFTDMIGAVRLGLLVPCVQASSKGTVFF